MVEQIIEYEDDLQLQENFVDISDYDELSYHHKVPNILDELDWNDMTDMIRSMDSEPGINLVAHEQVRYHRKNILSIRRKFVKEKLIMRATYKDYSSYITSASKFQHKSLEYIKQTDIYIFLNNINPTNPTNPTISQQCLHEIIEQVDTTLNNLHRCKSITDRQCILMYPNLSCVQLNYLYFVPDIHEVCFVFQ